jgi:mRNA interferase RelE/StbE
MGSFRVLVSRSAEKDLRHVEKSRIPSIVEKIEALGENPRPKGSRKLVGSECSYRIRSGDYRIVYTVDDGVRIVEIGRVRHRKDVYR